jgi:hypothetical protein
MVELDGKMLSAEIGIVVLLALQLILAVIIVPAGYLLRRWANSFSRVIGVLTLLILTGVTCGMTIIRCVAERAEIHGRMEGRIVGPFLSDEKAENSLALMSWYLVVSVAVAAATVLGAWLLGRLGRRHRQFGIAVNPAAAGLSSRGRSR